MNRNIGYMGSRRFNVSHPSHGSVTVSAPDEASAVYAAGYAWRTDPSRIDFYANCEVSGARARRGAKKEPQAQQTPAAQCELSADDQSTDDLILAQLYDFSKGDV